jgi:hypothetical protein
MKKRTNPELSAMLGRIRSTAKLRRDHFWIGYTASAVKWLIRNGVMSKRAYRKGYRIGCSVKSCK